MYHYTLIAYLSDMKTYFFIFNAWGGKSGVYIVLKIYIKKNDCYQILIAKLLGSLIS